MRSTAALLLLFCSHVAFGQRHIAPIEPPEGGFYSKTINCNGIPIKASSVVVDAALDSACNRIEMLLSHQPNVRQNLIFAGAELHIIGRSQQTSDLPEYHNLKGVEQRAHADEPVMDFDQRTRGMGGVMASCGEENLLRLIDDRFRGRDICVHEFAHAIYNVGLSKQARKAVERQYQTSLWKGRWNNNYAHENADEFFAELSMWYWGTHGDDPGEKIGVGKEALQKYDPDAYWLLDSIYSGRFVIPVDSGLRPDTISLSAPNDGLRSGSGDQCSLHIFNKSDRPLNLVWINYKGEPELKGKILPAAEWDQTTYVSHVWVVVDNQKKIVGEFVARSPHNVVILH